MNWLREHPLTVFFALAIVLILGGLVFVQSQRLASPQEDASTWGRVGAYLMPAEAAAPVPAPNQRAPVIDEGDPQIPITLARSTTSAVTTMTQGAAAEFQALLAEIAKDRDETSTQASLAVPNLAEAFNFLPLVQITNDTTRSALQEALFTYGNQLGLHVQAFDMGSGDMVQVLTDQVEDRSDPQKGAAVKAIGTRYREMGDTLAAMKNVPPSAKSAHDALVLGYKNLGTALSKVPDAQEDQAFIAAITAHNNAADAYTRAFISVASTFSSNGVEFSASDPGSVFTFSR